MKFQISYYSPNGHVEYLANELCRVLPRNTILHDLTKDDSILADTQIVGIEMNGTKLDAIPFMVLDYLSNLEGKIIFLYATVPFEPNEQVCKRLENSIIPFLPDECDYRGLYLCAAQPSDALMGDLNRLVMSQPDNIRAQQWLKWCGAAKGHPNKTDAAKLCQHTVKILELDQ